MESSAQPRSEGPWKRQSRWEDPSCNATGINHLNGKTPLGQVRVLRAEASSPAHSASSAASSSNAQNDDEAWGKWKPW